ncbi:hypothetical protein BB561_006426 [Smittium simulii]|uniref:Uncharacterized protein n=1 Tax=Smittium simulii TaxID=133385 RepID=A0A2T9Y4H0_9FUNG|nr:hypothetical protein BB561_006426 [Smittium simulii]
MHSNLCNQLLTRSSNTKKMWEISSSDKSWSRIKSDRPKYKNYFSNTLYPDLKAHINYVFKIRNRTYWAARRYAKSVFIEKRFIGECLFCRNITPETIENVLLECSRAYTQIIARFNLNEVSWQAPRGGVKTFNHNDPHLLCVKTTLATSKFLNKIALPSYLMLSSIRLVPIFTDKCTPDTGTLLPPPLSKQTRLEYSTVAKAGLIDPVLKSDCYFDFKPKKNQFLDIPEVDFGSDSNYPSSSPAVSIMDTKHVQKDSFGIINMELVNQLSIHSANIEIDMQ